MGTVLVFIPGLVGSLIGSLMLASADARCDPGRWRRSAEPRSARPPAGSRSLRWQAYQPYRADTPPPPMFVRRSLSQVRRLHRVGGVIEERGLQACPRGWHRRRRPDGLGFGLVGLPALSGVIVVIVGGCTAAHPDATAMAVDGRVVAGATRRCRHLGSRVRIVDLEGAFVAPFVDSQYCTPSPGCFCSGLDLTSATSRGTADRVADAAISRPDLITAAAGTTPALARRAYAHHPRSRRIDRNYRPLSGSYRRFIRLSRRARFYWPGAGISAHRRFRSTLPLSPGRTILFAPGRVRMPAWHQLSDARVAS